MPREECIKIATERCEFVRTLLFARLSEYLFKRSTKVDDGRQHIHYCNVASAQRLLRRFSENLRNDTPEPSDPVQTPPVSAPVTPPLSRLNPNAESFQPVSDNSSVDADLSDNDLV
jgi:hypothetical protein